VQYSVIDQRPGQGLDRVAQGNRIGLLCYGTVAGGFLSDRWLGAAQPAAVENRSLTKYQLIIDDGGGWDWFQGVLAALGRVAARHRSTIAAVALRWVLDRRAVAATIVGTRQRGHFDTIEAAFQLTLTERDRAEIGTATGKHPGPAGDVYTAERSPGKHAEIMRYDLNSQATN
jgi:aryl-alcohol dehydrogenase-like predicted oxidoreductase